MAQNTGNHICPLNHIMTVSAFEAAQPQTMLLKHFQCYRPNSYGGHQTEEGCKRSKLFSQFLLFQGRRQVQALVIKPLSEELVIPDTSSSCRAADFCIQKLF